MKLCQVLCFHTSNHTRSWVFKGVFHQVKIVVHQVLCFQIAPWFSLQASLL